MTLTPEQKAVGWIEWNGGDCPIKDDRTVIGVMLQNGSVFDREDDHTIWVWSHDGNEDDIIAYRIIEAHGADAEPPTEGTLVEIGARVGDTVQPIGGIDFVVTCDRPGTFTGRDSRGYNGPLNMLLKWRIVSRAAAPESDPARPTPFPASYDDLVFDPITGWSQTIIVDGKRPEWLRDDDAVCGFGDGVVRWSVKDFGPHELAIRVRRREPKRETVEGWLCQLPAHIGATPVTYDLIDGKPDLSTLKIAEGVL